MDLDPDADPDPYIFIIDLQDAYKKLIKKSFPAYYPLKVPLRHLSKIKSQKEVTKQYKARFFLLFLLNNRRIRIQEAQNHVDPDSDPDPQHCFKDNQSLRSHKTVETVNGRIRSRFLNNNSGSGRPKNLKILNTGMWE
jgi:hypothetical protein